MGSHWQTPGGNRPQMTAQRPRCVSGGCLALFILVGCLGVQSAKQLPQVNESPPQKKTLTFKRAHKEKEALKVSNARGKKFLQRKAGKTVPFCKPLCSSGAPSLQRETVLSAATIHAGIQIVTAFSDNYYLLRCCVHLDSLQVIFFLVCLLSYFHPVSGRHILIWRAEFSECLRTSPNS